MSSAFLGLDMASSAIAPAERAVVLSPDDGRARADLGEAYMRVNRVEDAIDSFEIALELLGNEPAVIRSLVECYAREDRFAEAINAGQVLISIEPTAQAWERLGRAYFRHGDYDASVESYRRAVEIDPKFWPALNGIGVNELNAWLRSGRKETEARDGAGEAFRASLRVYPDQPKVVQLLTTYPL
jgi:cytochrome c-type biogenesis protein CcmH/NrfG